MSSSDLEPSTVVIAGLVPAIHFAKAWTTGTSPVVTMEGKFGASQFSTLEREAP